MKKNILYILENDLSLIEGSSINEKGMVKFLLQNDISIFIPKPKKELDSFILKSDKVYIGKNLNRRNPFSYLFFLIHKIYLILRITKKEKIDVYIFRWGPLPIDILFLKIITGKRIFLKHLTFMRTSQKDGVFFRLSGFFKNFIIKSGFIWGADTPSFMTKKLVTDDYKIKRVLLAKNGSETKPILVENKTREFIYVGNLSKRRNTDVLLDIFEKSGREIDFYGFGDMTETVEEYSRRCPNINFKGKVSYEEIKTILPEYKFGIDLTFVSTKYGKASYSQKIAQYLSYGLNVIAIDCLDNEFVRDNNLGLLIDLDENNLIEKFKAIEYNKIYPEMVMDKIYNENILNKRLKFWNE